MVRARRAFTLIELLLVIAIIAILLALIAVAVFQAREFALNMECRSHLRQIGNALNIYAQQNGRYPPAHSLNIGDPAPPDSKWYFGWMARILPNIEQTAIYQHIRWDQHPWWNPAGGLPDGGYYNSRQIPLYLCPTDYHGQKVAHLNGIDVALTSYMGISGTDQFAFDGILHVNAQVNMDDVGDGLSNTLLVGERPASADGWYGWWFAGSGDPPYYGAADVVLGTHDRKNAAAAPEKFRPGSYQDPNGEHHWHFWSPHQGGANFLFADGHVQFIRYTGHDVLGRLATYKKGDVSAEDY